MLWGSEGMDADAKELKQAVIDKLRRNGTLDRIQAELRSAVFLAIENDEHCELETDKSQFNQRPDYSIIYHFLRQNRFLATAAVFEKEIHQKIISLEELKKEKSATTYLFRFSGDSITLSALVSAKDESKADSRNVTNCHTDGTGRKINEPPSSETGNDKTNDIRLNSKQDERYPVETRNDKTNNIRLNSELSFWKTLEREGNMKATEQQYTSNPEFNGTLKTATLVQLPDSGTSSITSVETTSSSKNSRKRSEKTSQSERSSSGKSINDEIRKSNEKSSSRSVSSRSSKQQEQRKPQTPKTSTSSSLMNFEPEQIIKSLKSPSSPPQPRRLPPITTPNETMPTKLPSIVSLTGTSARSAAPLFSRRLDTVLNSLSSNSNEADEDIAEQINVEDLMQSDNNSNSSISF